MRKILLFFFFALPVHAQEFDAKDFATLIGGGITSLLIHEGGHEFVAQYRDEDIEWSGTEWDCTEECNSKAIALGGFGAQQIGSHIILSFKPEGDYWKSVVAFNALHTAYYIVRNELSEDGHGDLANFERGDQRMIEAALILSTYAAYRRWPVTTDGQRIIFNIAF
jgi:hypothetical protein